MPNIKTFVVQVALNERQVKRLMDAAEATEGEGYIMAAIANTAMRDQGDGAMLIPPDLSAQILEACGGSIGGYERLLKCVEKANSFEDGCKVLKWRPDPTNLPYLEETAKSQGVEVEEYAQSMMDWALANHWYQGLPDNTKVLFLNREDALALGERLGKPVHEFNGTDVCHFIEGNSKPKQLAAPAEVQV
jgi:hypothetical protein